MKKTFSLLFFILFVGCGYKPIYKSINDLTYSSIIYIGDKKLTRQISSALALKEDKNNNNLQKITLDAGKKISVTSKNTKGENQSYRMMVYLNLIIEDSEKTIRKKSFFKNFAYNSKDNKFELIEYENQIENNLIKEIIEEVNIYLNT